LGRGIILTNLLFLCSRNRLRSPTAEEVFSSHPGVETASAGLAPDAEEGVTLDHLEWADIIFVMERVHQRRLQSRFRAHLKHTRVICLNIPDVYAYMQPELVTLLEKRVGPFLR
jgi:Predicted protein tyrosine phosphatase